MSPQHIGWTGNFNVGCDIEQLYIRNWLNCLVIMCLIVVSVCTALSNSSSVWLLTLSCLTTCILCVYYIIVYCPAWQMLRLSAILIKNIIIIIIIIILWFTPKCLLR